MAKRTGLVVDTLTDMAEAGDLPAIKVYLETIERLQEKNLMLRESAKEQANPLTLAISEGIAARKALLDSKETKSSIRKRCNGYNTESDVDAQSDCSAS